MQNEIERNAALTKFERLALAVFMLWPMLFILAAGLIFGGCSNTPSGVKIVASSASYTNIGDINWDEYKIPVLSLYLGPKATMWVNKDYKALDEVQITGSVTNATSALGIYDSREQKTLNLRVKFIEDAATNNVNAVAL